MRVWRFWRFIYLKISILFLFLISYSSIHGQKIDKDVLTLFARVDSNLRNTNGLEFKVKLWARMKDKNYKQEAIFKFQRSPLKIYYKQFFDNNIELLYDETIDKEKALVNPDGFPYTNLHLSPYSSIILKRQHHSIFEADPLYTLDQMFKMFDECKEDSCNVRMLDTVIHEKTYKIIDYNNLNYGVKKIKTKNDIHILDLAKKLNLNFYSIVWLNDDFDSSTEIDEGETIRIPSRYAKRIVLVIDTDNDQIIEVQVFDGKGLFEKMKYLYFRKDIKFKEVDFNKDNPEYNF